MTYPVIGLTGDIGAGKDTVAGFLLHSKGLDVLSFADPLYEMAAIVTRLPKVDLKDRAVKDHVIPHLGVSPRTILQTLGTEWGRNYLMKDIWIKHIDHRMGRRVALDEIVGQPTLGFVIPDVRFQNEVDYIHHLGGEVWRIDRLDNPHKVSTEHSSESGVHGIDRIIFNNGDLDTLHRNILKIVGDWK